MQRNIPNQRVTLYVYDSATGKPKTGVAASLAGTVSKDDGAYIAIASGAPTEDDAVRARGYYTWLLTQSESDAVKLKFSGTCGVAGIVVVPDTIYTNSESGIIRGAVDQRITLYAFDAATGLAATGLASDLTAYVSREDGTFIELADQTASEDDADSAAGYYTWDLASGETDGIKLKFSAVCGNTAIVVVPIVQYTQPAPSPAAPDPLPDPEPVPGEPVADMTVLRAGIPLNDGCPILTRIKAFIGKEGVAQTIEYTFRDGIGNPIDFGCGTSEVSESSSASASASADETVILVKFAEITGEGGPCGETYQAIGSITECETGTIRVKIPKQVYEQPGLYQVNFGYVVGLDVRLINESVLSVEPSLFNAVARRAVDGAGPPTIQQIRMQMWDSSGADNPRLDDVEFSDDQIVQAILKPLQYFNETNPPINFRASTRQFPWRGNWIDATIGYLHQFAAAYYRRNRLPITGGGKQLDEWGREQEYLRAAQMMLAEYKDWVLRKKTEINMAACVGTFGSSYSYGR